MITQELFNVIYTSGDYMDPPTELSQRLGITRNEAKDLAYMHLYSLCSTPKLGEELPPLWSDYGMETRTHCQHTGKKGDRVYQTPKAFWNKSK